MASIGEVRVVCPLRLLSVSPPNVPTCAWTGVDKRVAEPGHRDDRALPPILFVHVTQFVDVFFRMAHFWRQDCSSASHGDRWLPPSVCIATGTKRCWPGASRRRCRCHTLAGTPGDTRAWNGARTVACHRRPTAGRRCGRRGLGTSPATARCTHPSSRTRGATARSYIAQHTGTVRPMRWRDTPWHWRNSRTRRDFRIALQLARLFIGFTPTGTRLACAGLACHGRDDRCSRSAGAGRAGCRWGTWGNRGNRHFTGAGTTASTRTFRRIRRTRAFSAQWRFGGQIGEAKQHAVFIA